MSLPKQARPILRQVGAVNHNPVGIRPSGACGCLFFCLGYCDNGVCRGLCI